MKEKAQGFTQGGGDLSERFKSLTRAREKVFDVKHNSPPNMPEPRRKVSMAKSLKELLKELQQKLADLKHGNGSKRAKSPSTTTYLNWDAFDPKFSKENRLEGRSNWEVPIGRQRRPIGKAQDPTAGHTRKSDQRRLATRKFDQQWLATNKEEIATMVEENTTESLSLKQLIKAFAKLSSEIAEFRDRGKESKGKKSKAQNHNAENDRDGKPPWSKKEQRYLYGQPPKKYQAGY
ncbi:hypothetical protein DL768_009573 [Monosporascus sp. mg162]|nr:hypothetical protein DL768_009573 [Monosporascus sp. mg162]